ncbi:MAG TPA: hypothetical protein VKU41_31430 [Polyangiaceae bacterium]|nr:hypothetical protein [Polyangiaceae bacterium]
MSYAQARVPREPLLSTAPLLGGVQRSDEPDPELLSLPDPPRRERTVTIAILSLASTLSLAMGMALWHEVVYALGGTSAADLGDLGGVTTATLAAHENQPVRGAALLGAAGAIRYERPFTDDTFRALPVAGRRDLWVDVRVPAGGESGRWEPPHALAGRLVRFDAAGPRHRGLARAIDQTTHDGVPAGAFLLVDGEDPPHARWAVFLFVTFLASAAWNAASLVRLVRRVTER